MRAWIAVVGAACIVGSAAASMMVYIAIQHNPQGEFVNHEAGAVNYADLCLLFLVPFLVVGLAVGLVLAVVVRAGEG